MNESVKISEAIIVGALDTAIYREKSEYKALRLEENNIVDCTRDLGLILQSAAEKRHLEILPRSRKELANELRRWSKRHNLLRMIVTGMDPVCNEDTRRSCMGEAEPLMEAKGQRSFVQSRLFGCILAKEADVKGALQLSVGYPTVHQLYLQLDMAKDIIEPVLHELKNLIYFELDHNKDPDALLRMFVDEGVVGAAVLAVAENSSHEVEELIFSFMKNRKINKLKQVLTPFVKQIKETLIITEAISEEELSEVQAIDEIENEISAWKNEKTQYDKRSGRKYVPDLENKIASQKAFIVNNLRAERQDVAQKALGELVNYQHQTSELLHLCKSLCDLGSRAKELSHYEFAFKAYDYAMQANPDDPAVWSGYAEVLRSMGKFDEALAAYERSKDKFPSDDVALNGYAETLRAMRRFSEALLVYEESKEKFPDNHVALNGYAETLRSMSRFTEALLAYEESKEKFPDNDVALNGYAETLRSMEQFDAALMAYEESKEKFPDDDVALNGYAATLRSMGKFDAALISLEEAVVRFPNGLAGRNALACLYIEVNRPGEAINLLLDSGSTLQTEQDWRDHHVLAMAYVKIGSFRKAESMMLHGVTNAPTARQNGIYSNSLKLLRLKQNQPQKVIESVEPSKIVRFPIDALFYVHALAKTNRTSEAEAILDNLKKPSEKNIVQLSEYLQRRYLSNNPISTKDQNELDSKIDQAQFALVLHAA